jgi:Na+/H+-dicarboxylate symporter
MRKLILALLASIIAGILFGIIYPAVRGEAAKSSDDILGERLGTILIPAVFVITYGIGYYLEHRRKP